MTRAFESSSVGHGSDGQDLPGLVVSPTMSSIGSQARGRHGTSSHGDVRTAATAPVD
jgi:hypothetical protein